LIIFEASPKNNARRKIKPSVKLGKSRTERWKGLDENETTSNFPLPFIPLINDDGDSVRD
jgi:hypothetical protein